MTEQAYMGRRVQEDSGPVNDQLEEESFEERLSHIRDRQIRAAVRAYEAQLRFYFNTCPDLNERYLAEQDLQQRIAASLDIAADELIRRQEASFLDTVGENHG